MPKVFVPTGFEASQVSPDLYRFILDTFAEDIYVLLEFHSRGRQNRQVDMAVLGPYGVDVVEVKAKTGGAVIASPNSPWSIRYPDGRIEEIPLNGSAGENPYQQAQNTAKDLGRWLGGELGIATKVCPLVLVPQYNAASNMRNMGFIWTANGLSDLENSLRSLRKYKEEPRLTIAHRDRIVAGLGLTELTKLAPTTPEEPMLIDNTSPVAEQLPVEEPVADVSKTKQRLEPVSAPSQADSSPQTNNTRPRRTAGWIGAGLVGVCAVVGFLFMNPFAGRNSDQPLADIRTAPITEEALPDPADEVALPGVAYVASDSGPASQVPSPDGATCPASHPVKGNINADGEKIYHLSQQQYYEATRPEDCFLTVEAASAEGYRASLR